MRIALDFSSSSASASEVDTDREEEEQEERRVLQAAETSAQQSTPVRLVRRSRTPSTSSLLDLTPQNERKVAHLDRVNAARRVSANLSNYRPMSAARATTPRWMRETTPQADGLYSKDQDKKYGESDSEDNDDGSDIDSEEEQWPVAPYRTARNLTSSGLARQQREASIEAQELSQRIRLTNEADPPIVPRRIMSKRIASRKASVALSPKPSRSPAGTIENDFAEVQNLLANMRIQKEEEDKREREAFDARNKALWDSIESGIRQAEEIRAKAAREEEERQRRAKEQQEAAERRARETKEAEERRAKAEKEAEEKKKEEDEVKRKADEQAAMARAAEEAKEKNSGGVGNALGAAAREEYEGWWNKIQRVKQNVLPAVSQNTEWRKQCFAAKRIITRSVGQLTNSRAEITRITRTIGDVLTQAKGASPAGEIYTWILNHLSKCLIRQAEQEVAAKQDSAFPLAHVVVWLLLEGHTELGDVLMARLVKKCCWCLAFCPAKKAGQDDAAYAKVLGKAGAEEPTLQYTSRMSGITAMYFAICQTTPSSPPSGQQVDLQHIPPHFRPRALWIWQARMLSPGMMEHALAPALFSVLVEIAGPSLLVAHGKQTDKLWKLLRIEGLRNGKAGFAKVASANSARVRLQLLLDDWAASGQLEGATKGRVMGT